MHEAAADLRVLHVQLRRRARVQRLLPQARDAGERLAVRAGPGAQADPEVHLKGVEPVAVVELLPVVQLVPQVHGQEHRHPDLRAEIVSDLVLQKRPTLRVLHPGTVASLHTGNPVSLQKPCNLLLRRGLTSAALAITHLSNVFVIKSIHRAVEPM